MIIFCSKYSLDELSSAPEKIEIDGREYLLETYLVRDFMPSCPPDGRSLRALIFIVAIDSLPFPSSLDADSLWVIKENDLWITTLTDYDAPINYEYKLSKRAQEEGPKWGPEIYVDVVVRIVDDEDGTYLLRAADQWIHRTE
jgi:hypothetical protein